jgi:hypothetical protein
VDGDAPGQGAAIECALATLFGGRDDCGIVLRCFFVGGPGFSMAADRIQVQRLASLGTNSANVAFLESVNAGDLVIRHF